MKTEIVIEAPEPSDRQLQNIVESIEKIDEELKGTKEILKEFPMKSDELKKLLDQKKTLQEVIDEEKEKIETIHSEDSTYNEAKNDELRLTNQKKEKIAELKKVMTAKHAGKAEMLFKDEIMTATGGQMHLGLDFAPRVYINGKEMK